MGKTAKIILPDTYYLDYFNFVIEYVQSHYIKILQTPEKNFIKYFKQLSFESQCLYIRMANRKGIYFRPSKLVYREIKNVSLSISELRRREFISHNAFEEPFLLLNLFTKPEIVQISKNTGWIDFFHPSQRKEDITILICENVSPEEIEKNLSMYDPIISMKMVEEFELIKLLFFGHHYGDMSQFVIRDVGHAKFENYDSSKFTPHFKTRKEVDAYVFIYNRYKEYKLLMLEEYPLEEIYQWFTLHDFNDMAELPKSRKLFGKFANKLAYDLELAELHEEALDVYKQTSVYPSIERQLRILRKIGHNERAEVFAREIIDNSRNPKEIIFAQDFLASSGVKRITKSTTQRLKSGKEISIVQNPSMKVEDQAIQHLTDMGYEAFHTENFLWRSVFGLILWEEVFDETVNAIHNPLQRAPSDIHDEQFYENRKVKIKKKLNNLTSKKKTLAHMHSIFESKYGIANHFVYWHEDLMYLLEKLIQFVPLKALKNILLEMAKNTKDNSTGFPDLFLFKDREYMFYEVKSPNDHLSEQQLFWLDLFNNYNIKVDILKIKWITAE